MRNRAITDIIWNVYNYVAPCSRTFNDGSMLGQGRTRWASNKSTLGESPVWQSDWRSKFTAFPKTVWNAWFGKSVRDPNDQTFMQAGLMVWSIRFCTLWHNYLERMLFVDISVNSEPIPLKFCTGLSKSCPNIGKFFAKLNSIFQKLNHLSCNKIPELV